MDLKDILAISGHGGLFKYISQGRNGIIVEGLKDKKRMLASATAKVSSLEDIAIYTDGEDKPLSEVFDNIFEKENGGLALDHKSSNDELKKYLLSVLPEYDAERVYVSDIKKLLNWYNQLHELNMLVKKEDKKEEETVVEEKPEAKKTNPAAEDKPMVKKTNTEKEVKPKVKKTEAPAAKAKPKAKKED